MLYYSESARQSALENIAKLRKVIATIPEKYLNYLEAEELGGYLDTLTIAIKKESRMEETNRRIRKMAGI